jgi:DNA-binding NarL/FixJ family response regulator
MLLEEHISTRPDAKMLVLFGGNPLRRDEVIQHLRTLDNLSIIGTLSEEEGIATIKGLPRVDIVLIGGRYTQDQRLRIKSFLKSNYPQVKVTEPGVDYPYDERLILQHVRMMIS